MKDMHAEIEMLAYEIFRKKNGAMGNDLDNWLEAERIIKAWHEERQAAVPSITNGKGKAARGSAKKARSGAVRL
jgi:hypothetical protein